MIISEVEVEAEKRGIIDQYIDEEQVCFVKSQTRDSVIFELCEHLAGLGQVDDCKGFYESVMKREKLVSTGIGFGIAVPHAKLEDVDDFIIDVGVSKEPIAWNAIDGMPVQIIILIGGPIADPKKYLKILSQITLFLRDEKTRLQLIGAKERYEVAKLFEGW
ncbi:MAG: hypothetical protein S4CHLAM102_14580 [Chlamydiia bacterium]|nr:hypothetical protein [Chlamydiia bacterium]